MIRELFIRDAFDKFSCDKGYKHGYERFYSILLKDVITHQFPINLLEIGVFKGASMKAWKEILPPGSNVYGIDIFERVSLEDVSRYVEGDAKLFQDDSQNPQNYGQYADLRFDVIIDDGLHTPAANLKTFMNYFNLLSNSGKYVVEDVFLLHEMDEIELNHPWLTAHKSQYNIAEMNKFLRGIEQYGLPLNIWRGKRHLDNNVIWINAQ